MRWRWATLGALILITLALMFGGQVFGQGDGRPPFQAIPILGVTTADEMVKMGDLTNHAMRVSIVSGGTSNVNVISSVLPTGAALDVSVQNIEAAIREAMQPFGGGFATSGMAMGAKDPSGFMASLSVNNLGYLNVNVAAGGGSGGTSSTFGAAFPGTGTAAGIRDPSGFMASASATNNNALFVESIFPTTTNVGVRAGDSSNNALRVNVVAGSAGGPSGTIGTAYGVTVAPAGFRDGASRVASGIVDNASNLFVIASQGQANSGQPWFATGTMTVHQGDSWTVACSNCSGSTTTNYGSTFPAGGLAIGVKDGAGRFASMVVDNASNLFVIASQSSSSWTVTATGTVTAHQGDTWTVGTNTWLGSTAPTVGQKTMANSLPVVIASDQTAVPVSGTVTATVTPNATISLSYPTTVYANFKDGAGKVASALVDNASNLFTIASQSGTWTVNATGTVSVHQQDTWTVQQGNAPWSATGTITAHQGDTWSVQPVSAIGNAYPSRVYGIGFKDGAGFLASATVDNTGTLTVIASQGAANAGQAWTVNVSQYGGTTVVNGGTAGLVGVGGPTATGSQASANPVRMGAVARPTNKPTLADGNVADLNLSSSGDLYVRDDTSAATGTLAPARVQMQGGMGKNGVATAVTVCDQFATVSMGQQTNVQIITGPATGQIHICSIMLIAASATAVSIFEGSGTLCNTNRTPIFGSTATVNGLNLATTGGFTMGSGFGDIAIGQYTGSNVCLGNSTSAVVTGGVKWTSY